MRWDTSGLGYLNTYPYLTTGDAGCKPPALVSRFCALYTKPPTSTSFLLTFVQYKDIIFPAVNTLKMCQKGCLSPAEGLLHLTPLCDGQLFIPPLIELLKTAINTLQMNKICFKTYQHLHGAHSRQPLPKGIYCASVICTNQKESNKESLRERFKSCLLPPFHTPGQLLHEVARQVWGGRGFRWCSTIQQALHLKHPDAFSPSKKNHVSCKTYLESR